MFRSILLALLFPYGLSTIVIHTETGASLVVRPVVRAYWHTEPNVVIEVSHGPNMASAEARSALYYGLIDLATSTELPSAPEQLLHPSIVWLPLAGSAVAVVYNVDGCHNLTLTRDVFARIMLANITRWNHPDIIAAAAADGHLQVLPDAPITVVLPSDDSQECPIKIHGGLFMDTLGSIKSRPVMWPVSKYAAWTRTIDVALVLSNEFSIGCGMWKDVQIAHLDGLSLVNGRGNVVRARMATIASSIFDSGGNEPYLSDLTNTEGLLSWPIGVMMYIGFDRSYRKVNDSARCISDRMELIAFLRWMYSDDQVKAVVLANGALMLPDIVRDEIGILDVIDTQITCDGASVYVDPIFDIAVSGTDVLGGLLSLWSQYYQLIVENQVFEFDTGRDDEALLRLSLWGQDGDTDLAVFDPSVVRGNASTLPAIARILSSLDPPNSLVIVPVAMYGVVPIFNLGNVGTEGVVVTIDLLVQLFTGAISSWTHPDILSLNPTFSTQNDTIRVVVCCGHTNDVIVGSAGALFTSVLRGQSPHFRFDTERYSWTDVVAAHPDRFIVARDELSMAALVSATPGAIGYTVKTSSDPFLDVEMRIKHVASDGSASAVVVNASLDTHTDCASTRTYAELRIGNPLVTIDSTVSADFHLRCWPFHGIVAFASLSAYASTKHPCLVAKNAISFVQWITMNDPFTDPDSGATVLAASNAAIRTAALDDLYSVTCDGERLLVTLPIVWTIHPALTIAAQTISAVGMCLCITTFLVIVYHQKHPVFVASSIPFLILCLSGLCLLYAAAFPLVESATVNTCSATLWFAGCGFTMCFGPLFLKTWRVWRIFSSNRLAVAENLWLGQYLAALLIFDVVVLGVWQSRSPLSPVLHLRVALPNTYQYTHCTAAADPVTLVCVALIVIEKAGLLLFGAFIGLSSGSLSSKYNESQPIAWSIYNAVVVTVFCVGIITGTAAIGNTLVVLYLSVLLWTALATWALLFVPKLWTVTGCSTRSTVRPVSEDSDGLHKPSLLIYAQMFSVFNMLFMPVSKLSRYIDGMQAELLLARKRLNILSAQSGLNSHPCSKQSTPPAGAPNVNSGIALGATRSSPLTGGRSIGLALPSDAHVVNEQKASPSQLKVTRRLWAHPSSASNVRPPFNSVRSIDTAAAAPLAAGLVATLAISAE